ncbi:MAG: hypothetical protein NVS2B12_17850 [Ktedonobacteraceae bacterium]
MGYEGLYDGPEYRQSLGEKIIQHRMRWRRSSWPRFIVVAILLLGLSGFLTARYDRAWDSSGVHREESVFEVSDNAKLTVNSNNGEVYVHVGHANHIAVISVTHASGDEEQQAATAVNAHTLDSNTVSVSVNNAQGIAVGRAPRVDLDISVPETASVAIRTTSGAIVVEDVKGTIQIDATGGNIELDRTEGPVALTTSNGNIEVSDARLAGVSSFKTTGGNIDFAGELDPYGSYNFETSTGTTDITLPDFTVFHLNATTVNSTTIDNEFDSTSVGDGQHATVNIHTYSGHISIHQAD